MLSDKGIENLLNFERFAGRRIQRFPPRTPNSTSFYGLGWSKLTTYIGVKKLLFAMTIIRMKAENVIRTIFERRLEDFMRNTRDAECNAQKSPFFEIFSTCKKFGLLDCVRKMVRGEMPIYGKKGWSDLVWQRAWRIEDAYWKATNMMCKNNDLLILTNPDTRYLSWWRLADSNHPLMRMCETIARIVCRASRLKCDDSRFKEAPASQKTCEMCDQYAVENIHHIIMQCPAYNSERVIMYELIERYCPAVTSLLKENPSMTFAWIMGREVPGVSALEQVTLLEIAGEAILIMYNKCINNRVLAVEE